MSTTTNDIERIRERLADNKEEQKHLDKVIQEMHDEGWNDLSPSERAFVNGLKDECGDCNKKLDDCTCQDKKKLPSYAVSDDAAE